MSTTIDTKPEQPAANALVDRGEAFLKIATPEEYAAAGAWLTAARTFTKRLDAHFADSITKAREAWKATIKAVSDLTDPVTQRADAVDLEMKAFRRRAEDARAAAERKIEAEQRAADAAEREAAALMAEEDGDDVQAETIRQAPPASTPVHVPVHAYVPPVAGLSSRKEWKSKITDLRKLGAAVGRGDVGTECLIGIGKHAKLGHLRSKGCDGLAKSFGSLLTAKGWGIEAYEADITVTSSGGDE
jgi:hypothetical protein